jgi:monoamine oxidase
MPATMTTTLTRRQCLALFAKLAGGSAALLQAANVMGITASPGNAEPVIFKSGSGQKKSVVLLGAGIASLTAALELSRAGFRCTILEASHRVGGRNLTVRSGDFIDEIGNPQICPFDPEPHLYFNCGPARIPAEHTALMHYCRELNIPLQLFSNYNSNCYTHDDKAFNGKPIRIREYETDLRGFMNELLGKSLLKQGKLDESVGDIEFERMLEFVRQAGDLDKDLRYIGSERASFASGGITAPGKLKTPRKFEDLLHSDFGLAAMHFMRFSDQAPAVMTPIGGMDQVVKGFLRNLDLNLVDIKLNSPVRNIQLHGTGVNIEYEQQGVIKSIQADYCINAIPSQLLAGISNNFSARYRQAMSKIHRGNLIKVGFQAKKRFWEDEQIFAGISWTNQDITQLWYPEHGFMQKKGVLLGAYSWEPDVTTRFMNMSHQQRLEAALQQGEKIHPNYRQHIESGVSICWQRMNHLLGCGSYWHPEDLDEHYTFLQKPEGKHFLVGDQMGLLPGWQEAAIRSSWLAMSHIREDLKLQSGGMI